MKPKINYLLTADSVIFEEGTKKPTAVGIFQNVNIPEDTKEIFISFSVLVYIENIKGQQKLKVAIFDTKGEEMNKAEIEREFDDNNLNMKINFIGCKFSEKGSYEIKVFLNNEQIPNERKFVINVP